ncbi:MAG: FecR domain-containing protein [Burkholderiaceae bacterium]|nr:FecR domain-containing protein [Burkholderiaceae bacterium]
MKTRKIVLSIIAACTVVMGASSVWAQSAAVSAVPVALKAGVVKVVNGDVRVRDVQGERPLKPGDPVFANDRLVSGKQGAASVVLRDGTTVVLADNSQLEIQKFAFDATTQDGNILVSLLQGSMRMLTGLIAKVNPDAIQVKTKTLSVGIRGTDFIVETEETI